VSNKTEFIQIRVSKDFKEAAIKKADEIGITLSGYIKLLMYKDIKEN